MYIRSEVLKFKDLKELLKLVVDKFYYNFVSTGMV
jgi:hypothetical protein